MAKPQKPKPSCFPGLLRVLLCAGNATSPPVHPSDHITESEESQNAHSTKEKMVENAHASTPGVVARLMGLDSLPNPKWAVKVGTPDCFPRSRSVNFVDYLLEFDPSHANHRRVKTSASFREVPSLLMRPKGDEKFVLCMDGDSSNMSKDQHQHEVKKLEKGLGELRQRKRNKEIVIVGSVKKERNQGKSKKISKLKNEPRRVPSKKHGSKSQKPKQYHGEARDLSSVSSNSSKCGSCSNRRSGASSRSRLSTSLPSKHKKGFVEAKVKKNMRNQNSMLKLESECRLENHSQISVQDSNDYPFLYGPDFLDGTSTLASKLKWESPSLLSLNDGVEDSASTTNKGYSFIDVNKDAEYYFELMLKLRTLTEQDITELNCTSKHIRESESFEDICLMFEHKIFDLLLYEVVNEVLELYC
ncbi:uncharacterized protein LOC109813630 [Cajanus cajan]|uniref:DUF3741 domain-containing protein n=1 Tax=Cajanus cajan TaxID=3821 RepID=A0A151S2Q0_CAJCA|nr:uncharacterized protein LOC109813630 [Cajanus cajan]KYP49080.1 hypothetical protein KK1_029202 [Cajanus cajan]